jgi:hypothetical protein
METFRMASFDPKFRFRLRLVKAIAGVCLAVGLLLIALAVRGEFVARRMDASGVRATGTVIEKVSRGDNLVAPKIQFTTATGRTIVFLGRASESPGNETVGDTLTLFYDPEDPDTAWTSVTGYYIGPIIPGAIGLALAGAGMFLFFIKPSRPLGELDPRAEMERAFSPGFAEPRRAFSGVPVILVCFLLVLGLPTLFGAGYWAFSNYRADALGWRATGTVVGYVAYNAFDKDDSHYQPEDTHYLPRVRFTTATGQTVEVTYNNFVPDGIGPGDTISLSYDPSAPEKILIRGGDSLYTGPIAIGIFGALLVGAALLTAFLGRDSPRRLEQRARMSRHMAKMQDEPRRRAGPR